MIRAFLVENKRDLAPLLVGFLLFFVSGVVDILISVNVIVFLYTVQYAFLVMVLTMDYVLLKRFLGVFREAETLNVRLEEKVQERTQEITRIAEELRSANELLASKNKAHYERASPATSTPEIAGRYGGDEFALAVPFCGEQESRRIAERICARVRGALIERMPALQVTCSVGCAVLVNHRADQDPLDLLRAADAALYEAKRRGRNQESIVVV